MRSANNWQTFKKWNEVLYVNYTSVIKRKNCKWDTVKGLAKRKGEYLEFHLEGDWGLRLPTWNGIQAIKN